MQPKSLLIVAGALSVFFLPAVDPDPAPAAVRGGCATAQVAMPAASSAPVLGLGLVPAARGPRTDAQLFVCRTRPITDLPTLQADVTLAQVAGAVDTFLSESGSEDLDMEALRKLLDQEYPGVALLQDPPKYEFVEIDGQVWRVCKIDRMLLVTPPGSGSPIAVIQRDTRIV